MVPELYVSRREYLMAQKYVGNKLRWKKAKTVSLNEMLLANCRHRASTRGPSTNTNISVLRTLAYSSQVALTATIAWAVRLLVMYDPMKRRKWGRYTNEKRIFHGLIWTYVLIEVTIWASACVFGLQR